MKYLVAVSGGVDSVALLDMLVKRGGHQLIVAHFDHGMRPDSAADARFVEALAGRYKVPFATKREELGKNASEATARAHRYAFLHSEAEKTGAIIVTAHHLNDLVETVAINLRRGTGWQGLAVLGSLNIVRPLITMTKEELRDYALRQRLEWVEDSTNNEQKYLRNKLRAFTSLLSDETQQKLLALRNKQVKLRDDIDKEATRFLKSGREYNRYFFIVIEPEVALLLLRRAVECVTRKAPTRPQAMRALLAIKTARAGSTAQIGEGVLLRFTATVFIVEQP
jgi:tRNA(Ile)-lysidine synthetase-like protein